MERVRLLRPDDRGQLERLWTERYGGTLMLSRGRQHAALRLPGFVWDEDGALLGAVTYALLPGELEVVTLDSLRPGRGIGAALLEAVVQQGRELGVERLCLVTTNDNLPALRFYQKRGWDLCALHRNALAETRRLKPGLPLLGEDGIPLRHELELELRL